jgi:hypothetical protein
MSNRRTDDIHIFCLLCYRQFIYFLMLSFLVRLESIPKRPIEKMKFSEKLHGWTSEVPISRKIFSYLECSVANNTVQIQHDYHIFLTAASPQPIKYTSCCDFCCTIYYGNTAKNKSEQEVHKSTWCRKQHR